MRKNFAKAQLKCDKLVNKAREALFAGNTKKSKRLIEKKDKLWAKMMTWKISDLK